jgi:hypothetical protein
MEPLVDRARASSAARDRLKVILNTLGGGSSVEEGCARLSVKRTRFQDLRRRMIEFAAWGLEERPVGRPPSATERESEAEAALRARVFELEHEVLVLEAQLDIASSPAAEAVAARLAWQRTRR